jgi:hypothetical protein
MTPAEASAFVKSFDQSSLRNAPLDVRQDVLIWISNGFQKMRIRQGLPAFDDPIALLGEKPNVFQRILAVLMPTESSAEEKIEPTPSSPPQENATQQNPTPEELRADLEIPDFLKITQADRARAWGNK